MFEGGAGGGGGGGVKTLDLQSIKYGSCARISVLMN